VYWQHEPYIGLGPGAHSYLPPVRSWNVRDWGEYQARIAAGSTGTASDERVEGESLELERIWLGLRAAPGLAHSRDGGSGVIFSAAQLALLDEWQAGGLVEIGGGHVLPTTSGWLVLDRLAVELSEKAETAESPASQLDVASAG
jgi:oxygen-independent coproporphyrinogen-3 oxidase